MPIQFQQLRSVESCPKGTFKRANPKNSALCRFNFTRRRHAKPDLEFGRTRESGTYFTVNANSLFTGFHIYIRINYCIDVLYTKFRSCFILFSEQKTWAQLTKSGAKGSSSEGQQASWCNLCMSSFFLTSWTIILCFMSHFS